MEYCTKEFEQNLRFASPKLKHSPLKTDALRRELNHLSVHSAERPGRFLEGKRQQKLTVARNHCENSLAES